MSGIVAKTKEELKRILEGLYEGQQVKVVIPPEKSYYSHHSKKPNVPMKIIRGRVMLVTENGFFIQDPVLSVTPIMINLSELARGAEVKANGINEGWRERAVV